MEVNSLGSWNGKFMSLWISIMRWRMSHYTSVHYVIKPDNDYNDVCCEIQVEHYLKKFGRNGPYY